MAAGARQRPLRIGVNALYLIPGGVGGTEIYLRCLLEALAALDPVNRWFVITNRETGSAIVPEAANFTAVPQPVRAAFRPARILWEQTALPLTAARLGLDVLFNPGFTAPLASPCPSVTVFHDLQHKRLPENFRWFDLPFWRVLLHGAAHVSKVLIADSAGVKEDLLRYYRLPEEKVRVAPLGVDPKFFGLWHGAYSERPYVMAASTLHPHKNLDRLLRAFAEFRAIQPEFRLVVAGLRGFAARELERLHGNLGLGGAVEFTGWIPRERLYELYAGASAFIFPSLFEGFGLPLVEAMAAGIPAACSRLAPMSEIAGGAALLFDPYDVPAITEALVRITGEEELRRRLAEEGPRRAAEFPWSRTAEVTLEAIVAGAG